MKINNKNDRTLYHVVGVRNNGDKLVYCSLPTRYLAERYAKLLQNVDGLLKVRVEKDARVRHDEIESVD